jgi:hypothetical protein
MKYTIAIQTEQMVEVDAETAQQAIEQIKSQLDLRQAASARFSVVTDLVYDAATNTYMTEEMLNDKSRVDTDTSDERTNSENA